MATYQNNHRTTTQSRKSQQSHGRSQRPSQLAKRHSSYAVHRAGKSSQIRESEAEDDMMAASFLQYCATCEKQIVTPSNSILYCSESCRRKDNQRIPSYADQSPPLTPLQTSASFEKLPNHDIIPQRSPTAVNPTNRYSYSSFSEDETMYSEDEKSSSSRRGSEAALYLRQVYNPELAMEHSRTPRPHYKRSSTGYSTYSAAPSLSHSPVSTTPGMSFPYTPSTNSRPLPPRTNPSFSTSFKYSRSIDLVNPFPTMTQIVPTTAPSSLHSHSRSLKSGAGATTSHGFAEGEVIYEKTPTFSTLSAPGPDGGSLKKLFRFSEMQAPPAGYPYARY